MIEVKHPLYAAMDVLIAFLVYGIEICDSEKPGIDLERNVFLNRDGFSAQIT